MKQAFILMALCTLFMYSCTVASHSTTVPTPTTVHDTLKVKVPVHDTLKEKVPVHDTVIKPPVHDTLLKPIHDTITIHDSIPAPVIKKDSSSKTFYLRDLGIVPNTGECLTDKLLQVINKAVATGGKTTLVFSDEGEYKLLNGIDFLKGLAPVVTFKYDCYPNDIKSIGVISIKPCK